MFGFYGGLAMRNARSAQSRVVILLIAAAVYILVANVLDAISPVQFCFGGNVCPHSHELPLLTFIQAYPLLSITLVVASGFLGAAGLYIAHEVRTKWHGTRLLIATRVAQFLQKLPILTVIGIAIAALALFPNP